jgi:hypothetical protein
MIVEIKSNLREEDLVRIGDDLFELETPENLMTKSYSTELNS